MGTHKGIELQVLENWEEWDSLDTLTIVFYNATLKVDLLPCKKGDTVDTIVFDFENSVIEISNDSEGVVCSYNMILNIGEKNKEIK